MASFPGPVGGGATGRDPAFMEAIGQRMQIPERLSVGPSQQWAERESRPDHAPPAYSMTIPDRLTYTEAPDLSARPEATPPSPAGLSQDSDAERLLGDVFFREHLSPMRRSFSDQMFGQTKQSLALYSPRHPERLSHHQGSPAAPPAPPLLPAPPSDVPPPSLLSPRSVLKAARELGQQASQRLLQTVSNTCQSRFQCAVTSPSAAAPVFQDRSRKSGTERWSLDDEGAAVELIVLRRQIVKISRRLAGLERQNCERRQTEVLLTSLLLSACLLNAWLWLRR